jgi:predicted  nucleic acid-binding Zn-ribbon protein
MHYLTHKASASAAAKPGNGYATLPATTATSTISTKKFSDEINSLREAICQLENSRKIDKTTHEDMVRRVNVLEEDFGQHLHELGQHIHEQAQQIHEQAQRILAIEEVLAQHAGVPQQTEAGVAWTGGRKRQNALNVSMLLAKKLSYSP